MSPSSAHTVTSRGTWKEHAGRKKVKARQVKNEEAESSSDESTTYAQTNRVVARARALIDGSDTPTSPMTSSGSSA